MIIEIKNIEGKVIFTTEAANLSSANLSSANLRYADLRYADLSSANLRSADLRYADLRYADLRSANLSSADLRSADLRSANLSQSKGLNSATSFLSQFMRDELGFIVFRSEPGERTKPESWKFEAGAFLTEIPNPCRTNICGSGVSFSTLKWAKDNYLGPYWKCRIRFEDLADVVVPYNTDGKARCARLELIEKVE